MQSILNICNLMCKTGSHRSLLFQLHHKISSAPSRNAKVKRFYASGIGSKMPEKNGLKTEVKVTGYGGGQSAPRRNGIIPDCEVDLRSDTFTKPSQGMREAIANAIVGDDVFLEDPTTKEFETRVANLLGKEAALFVTSGTLGNLLCSLVHCDVRGSELICGHESHMFQYEQGNISQFGGIHSSQIPNEPDGTFSIEKLKEKIRMDDIHYPITKLVCLENTHNRCGGRILPLKWLDELAEVCKENNIPIHMDGARLFNAMVATGIPASRIVKDMTSVTFCLSKGLGAPVGAVIASSRPFIEQARRLRKALGSGMRQSGILTAAGIYCLDNMIDRLKEDHDNAKAITKIVNAKGGKLVWIDEKQVETNIIVLNVNLPCSSAEFCERLNLVEDELNEKAALGGKTVGVKCFPWTSKAARLVTHFEITQEMAEMGANKICYLAQQIAKESVKAVAV